MIYNIFLPIIIQVFLFMVAANGRPDGERSTREQQSISIEEYEEQLRINSRYRDHGISGRFFEVDSGSYHHELMTDYWNAKGRQTLHNHLMRHQNNGIAKNVIFFLGDGMSVPTITAARIYLGQLNQQRGEEAELSFEKFPNIGLSKTYCVDRQVADSACSATAYLCGVKANFFTIGVNANVEFKDCESERDVDNHVQSLAYWAQRAGKGTGIITTSTVSDASPAGAFAHSSNRLWESDADVIKSNNDPQKCQDIASQLIKNSPGNKFNVIMGGGTVKFLPKDAKDVDGNAGEREDGENLIELWKQNNPNGEYITNREGLQNIDYQKTTSVLGLFTPGYMSYNLDANRTKEPSLEEMTAAAIKLLETEENGYFLFVEGGRIDHGNHETKAHKAVDETVEFHKAIQRAVNITSQQDTLIVVTSDHSHTLSIAGYPQRGANILGINRQISELTLLNETDNIVPIATLSYANGPGFVNNIDESGTRKNLAEVEFHKDFLYPATVDAIIESHGGDDVGVFAFGPYSHLFSGVYEQNAIPHFIKYAACMGEQGDSTACNRFRSGF